MQSKMNFGKLKYLNMDNKLINGDNLYKAYIDNDVKKDDLYCIYDGVSTSIQLLINEIISERVYIFNIDKLKDWDFDIYNLGEKINEL